MEEEEKNKKLSFVEFLRTVKWLVVYNIRLTPVATIFGASATILLMLNPIINAYIFARLLDRIIKIASTGSDLSTAVPLLSLLLAYNLINLAIKNVGWYCGAVMYSTAQYKAPLLFHRHLNTLGIQTLENPEVVNKIQRSREALGSLVGAFEGVMESSAQIIVLVVALLSVVKIMPVVVVVVLGSMLPGLISNRYYMRKDWQLYRDATESRRRSGNISNTLMEPVRLQEITITSAYRYLNNVCAQFVDTYLKMNLRINRRWHASGFLLGSLEEIASIFGYVTIFKNFLSRSISLGDVTFQMRALDIFVSNLSYVITGYGVLYEKCIRIAEVKEVFDMKPMVSDGTIMMEHSVQAPTIVFKDVNFKYPNSDRYVLHDLNIEIKPGEKIAIVGENGAGKTTLVKLLSRFYRVEEGGIYLNNENINNIKIDSWYKNLGVLFQDYNTYESLSLKENILLGDSHTEVDEAKVELAANRANVDSFMDDYAAGYDQVLSEKFKGGTRPSTGQWQKIAIARFFYRNSPVVIFDEPTASIDAVSEAEIFGQIYEFFEKKTVIIISHRFSTVRNADKIYVLDEGKIAESGTHDQLMELKGKYYNAFTIQAEGYK